MPTRWIWPCGPYVASVEDRCWSRNSAISASLITTCPRWFAMSASEGVGRGDAAVDRDLGTVDVGRLVAGEVDVERRDVLAVADPAQRHLGGAVLHRRVAAVH